jgi:hypothetical protein
MTWQTLPPHLESRIVSEISPKTALKEKCNKYYVSDKENRIQDNITFSSKKEMVRYNELKQLLQLGQISDLVLQPKFVLQEKFTDSTGKNHREICYVADFQYKIKDIDIVEDVKGFRKIPVYLIKKKLFLFRYPQYVFIEG